MKRLLTALLAICSIAMASAKVYPLPTMFAVNKATMDKPEILEKIGGKVYFYEF